MPGVEGPLGGEVKLSETGLYGPEPPWTPVRLQ